MDSHQAKRGRAYIDKLLDRGHPALVGVSYGDNRYNRDQLTDHFVTIYAAVMMPVDASSVSSRIRVPGGVRLRPS